MVGAVLAGRPAVSQVGTGTAAANANDAGRQTVRGTLQRTWSQRRDRFEYYVVDAKDGVRYYVSTNKDLSRYLGRTVTVNGKPSVREGQRVAQVGVRQVTVAGSQAKAAATAAVAPVTYQERMLEEIEKHRVSAHPVSAPVVLSTTARPAPRVLSAQHVEAIQMQPGAEVIVEGEVPASPAPAYVPDISGVPIVESPPIIDSGATLGLPPMSGEACEHCGQQQSRWYGTTICPCGPPHRVWGQVEILAWSLKGTYLPPLVTTSDENVDQDVAGVLGQPSTTLLYGDERILTDPRGGLRFRLGTWLDCCQAWGIESDLFALEDTSETFTASSQGVPVIARPFFNAVTGLEDANLVAYPNVTQGSVTATTDSKFGGLGIRGRWNLLCRGCQTTHPRSGHNCFRGMRVDALGGYRYLQLREDLTITEDSSSLITALPVSFLIQDQFRTRNDFHGLDFGLLAEWERCRWVFGATGRIAVGYTRQQVSIAGSTATTVNGATTNYSAGMLALSSNSGKFTHDTFTTVPEIGLSIGYQISPRLRATFGYTLIYWNHVVRAGNQIDRALNPNLFPPENPPIDPVSPTYVKADSDFWAQGLELGLRYVW